MTATIQTLMLLVAVLVVVAIVARRLTGLGAPLSGSPFGSRIEDEPTPARPKGRVRQHRARLDL
jgi:hypothetical protein